MATRKVQCAAKDLEVGDNVQVGPGRQGRYVVDNTHGRIFTPVYFVSGGSFIVTGVVIDLVGVHSGVAYPVYFGSDEQVTLILST
jgi:hypothetical protein